jgi:hypothetical protein
VIRKKLFFRTRTARDIARMSPKKVYSARNLVRRLADMDFDEDSLELRFPVIPSISGDFRSIGLKGSEASRKYHKHGLYVRLDFPITQKDSFRSREIPLKVRKRSLQKLEKMKEENIDYAGVYWRPVQTPDRRLRFIPFAFVLEGAKLFAYSETATNGIEVNSKYTDSRRVSREGGEILCRIPSRTRKKGRYRMKMIHVPLEISEKGTAIATSLKSDFDVSPENREYDIRYTWEYDREASDRFVFYPQDIAGYMKIVRTLNKEHNLAPLVFNPLMFPSRLSADFYRRLENNVIIYDPSMKSRNKLRKLHLPEKSILLARSVGVFGHDATFYWDFERDGKIDSYEWGS